MISNLWVIMLLCPMFYPPYPSSKLVACYIVTTETFDMMRFHFFTKLYLSAPERESVKWLNEALWADITSDSDLDPPPVSAASSGSMNIPGWSFYKSLWFQVSGSCRGLIVISFLTSDIPGRRPLMFVKGESGEGRVERTGLIAAVLLLDMGVTWWR